MKIVPIHLHAGDSVSTRRRLDYALLILSKISGVHFQKAGRETARIVYGGDRPYHGAIHIPSTDASSWKVSPRHAVIDGLDLFHPDTPPHFAFRESCYGFDLLYAIFAAVTGMAEGSVPKNELGRMEIKSPEIIGIGRPVVHDLAEHFAARLFDAGICVDAGMRACAPPPRPWPGNKQMAMLLTLDIDHFPPGTLIDYPSTFRRARHHILRDPLKGSGLLLSGLSRSILESVTDAEEDAPFYLWRKLSRDYGIKSTYFVATRNCHDLHAHKWDVEYDPRHVRIWNDLERLSDNGHEVTLHPSINARTNRELFSEELATIRKITRRAPRGVRHHYLALDPELPERTLELQRTLGLTYDLSFALRFISGFPRGIAMPFKSYNREKDELVDLWSIPTQVMDAAMSTAEIDIDENVASLLRVFETVHRNRGVMVLDFHHHTLSRTMQQPYHRYGEALRGFLSAVNLSDVWTPTAREFVDHLESTDYASGWSLE